MTIYWEAGQKPRYIAEQVKILPVSLNLAGGGVDRVRTRLTKQIVINGINLA